MNDLIMINGGVNWDRVFGGTSAEVALVVAVALTPEISVPAFAIACGFSALNGAYTGYGLATN